VSVKQIEMNRWGARVRARSIEGNKARYKLSAGGKDPSAPAPFTTVDGVYGSDCIGFVLWTIGLSRYQPQVTEGTIGSYGGWINTDSAIGDARTARVFFEVTHTPKAGDLVVFPGIVKNGKRVRIGHVGLITETKISTADWTPHIWERPARERAKFLSKLVVIDCAAAFLRRLSGYAVKETTAAASWNKPDAVFLRYKHWVP